MKRKLLFLLLALLLLTGCAKEPPELEYRTEVRVEGNPWLSATVLYDDASYTSGTLETRGYGSYPFRLQEDGAVAVTYPDGTAYTLRQTALPEVTGDPVLPPKEVYGAITRGAALLGGERSRERQPREWSLFWIALVLGFSGLLNYKFPESAWEWEYGMWIKDAEPTEHAIQWSRDVGKGLLCLAGFLFILFLFP